MSTVEKATSLELASQILRTDIELPGALRYLTRQVRDIHAALRAIKGLYPTWFSHDPTVAGFAVSLGSSTVLIALRAVVSRYLPDLPTPFGFNPSRSSVRHPCEPFQQRPGRDPPQATLEDSTTQQSCCD